MQYKAIFIDIDDTLLDYVPCCREAFEAAMPGHPDYFDLFFSISGRLFSEAKRGLHTVAEVMDLYPAEFIKEITDGGLPVTDEERERMTETFKHAFRAAWGETHILVPGAVKTLDVLKNRGYRLFAASNSFGHLQRRRLERAGILRYFEDTFISMDIGYDKPDIRFFDYALNRIQSDRCNDDAIHAQELLMIGDSMTTDIIGAKRAGWSTCFFNRRPEEGQDISAADYVITELTEVLELLDKRYTNPLSAC